MTDLTSQVTIGSLAPDFSLIASNGVEVKLADYRSKSNVVLFFVREYNWIQCRSHASQLGRLYKEFKAANCELLVILGEPVEKARNYAEVLHLPNLVLADPERIVYHQFELEKVFLFLQRTASIVIDRQGIIRYLKSATNPMTWLQDIHELLDFVKSIEG